MPQSRPCPSCHAPGSHWLEGVSKDAYVDYFRCQICGHVWNTPKAGATGEARNVTEHGPVLDSQLRVVRFVFDAIELGFSLLQSADRFDDPETRGRILSRAQRAHDRALRIHELAPLRADERRRIQSQLGALLTEITARRVRLTKRRA
jgi:hypothetical protein